MKLHQRKRILVSLAAKRPEKLNGKYSRKDVEKYLGKIKKTYSDLKIRLQDAESKLSGLNEMAAEYREGVDSSREAMVACYEMMKRMDMLGAGEVKVKDNQDIAYACDGKWMKAHDDGSSEPFSKWKKEQKEQETATETDEDDVSDADDATLNEGYEVAL